MKIFTATSSALIFLSSFRDSNTVESFTTTNGVTSGRSKVARTNDKHPMNSFATASRLFSTVGEQQQQQTGGPPASVRQGGPPSGGPQGGPPQGGPPQGGPTGGGGPPPQTTAQKLLEKGLDIAFNFLYIGDDIGLQDSSKNLRVLWTRVSEVKLRRW